MSSSTRTLRINTPRVFAPLLQPGRYKGAYGGRGSGKSHFFAERVVDRALDEYGLRVVCIREVQKSLKESAKRLIDDKIEGLGVGAYFRSLTDHIVTPGGGIVLFQGMQDHTSESIKSLEGFDIAWIEEGQTLSERSLEILRPTIRKPESEIWASWNPRNATDPLDALLRGAEVPRGAIVVRANWRDNPFFPQTLRDELAHDKKHKPDRYAHIWEGEYEPTAIGAIWSRQNIHQNRRAEAPDLERILVAIDPAVSNNANSDEHGIIVVAQGADKRGYVIDDQTIKGSPRQWASRAISTLDRYEADAIVIEVNQGGDMVRHTLESVRPGVRIIEVRATRGKHVRAEPISALYEQDRISHVGSFPELEQQMCQITSGGYCGDGSPDRVDAMVWGFTELFPKLTALDEPEERYREYSLGENSWMG